MDPISLLMAAQATVAAIKRGCELLSEGKQEISKLKKTVEQAWFLVSTFSMISSKMPLS